MSAIETGAPGLIPAKTDTERPENKELASAEQLNAARVSGYLTMVDAIPKAARRFAIQASAGEDYKSTRERLIEERTELAIPAFEELAWIDNRQHLFRDQAPERRVYDLIDFRKDVGRDVAPMLEWGYRNHMADAAQLTLQGKLEKAGFLNEREIEAIDLKAHDRVPDLSITQKRHILEMAGYLEGDSRRVVSKWLTLGKTGGYEGTKEAIAAGIALGGAAILRSQGINVDGVTAWAIGNGVTLPAIGYLNSANQRLHRETGDSPNIGLALSEGTKNKLTQYISGLAPHALVEAGWDLLPLAHAGINYLAPQTAEQLNRFILFSEIPEFYVLDSAVIALLHVAQGVRASHTAREHARSNLTRRKSQGSWRDNLPL